MLLYAWPMGEFPTKVLWYVQGRIYVLVLNVYLFEDSKYELKKE